jgi:hypothetical protein
MSKTMHIPQEDLILYAMQALAPKEQASIKQHLEGCESCRVELAAVSSDLALASMSVEQHPLPDGARQRFIKKIGAAATANQKVVSIAARPVAPVSQSRMALWIPWTAVAALALFAARLGVELHRANIRLEQHAVQIASEAGENQRAREVLEVLTAPAAQHALLTAGSPRPAPAVRAIYVASRGALVLEGSNLAQIDAGKTYQFWIIPANGKAPIPAGLFRPDAAGHASVVLPQIPSGIQARAFGVTIENAGGSSTPTLPIVLAGAPSIAGE